MARSPNVGFLGKREAPRETVYIFTAASLLFVTAHKVNMKNTFHLSGSSKEAALLPI
jgi:hypothetical protein